MYLEYRRMHLGKEPQTFITEEFHNVNDDWKYPARRLQYGTILTFIKDFFKDTDIFKYYEYNIEIKHINTDPFSSKAIIDNYKQKSNCKSSEIEKYKVCVRSAEYGYTDEDCARFKFWLSGTCIVKYEFCNPDYMSAIFRDKWPPKEEVKSDTSNDNPGTVTVSSKEQSVEGTSLVIGSQADEFMKTMNTKFTRKKGEK
jgi:hypothetical protein